MKNIHEINHLKKQGFVHVRNIFSKKLCKKIADEIEKKEKN